MSSSSNPLVSIITPVYNAEAYIGRCIQSVLGQTYPHWEQFIIDDGSTDGTRDVVERYKDSRIHYIALPHRGLSKLAETYNAGWSRARGSLVAILEGDDFWPANKLKLQVAAFDDPEIVITWGRALVVDEQDRVSRLWHIPGEGRLKHSIALAELFRILTRKNVLVPAAAVMLRNDALRRIGGFQQTGAPFYVDLPTWLRVAATATGKAALLPDVLAYYRVHSHQTSAQRDYEMRFQHLDVVLATLDSLDSPVLGQLQWSEGDLVAAHASAHLSRGTALLRRRDLKAAREHFAMCLRKSRITRERAIALLGWSSAACGLDFLKFIERARKLHDTHARRTVER